MITIANANALHIPLPNRSVQCIVTSPPYWGLRDYGTAKWEGGNEECDHEPSNEWLSSNFLSSPGIGKAVNGNDSQFKAAYKRWYKPNGSCPRCGARRIDAQIGLESTPAEYVAHIVAVMRECKRVLRDDGTLWLNLGASYSSLTIMSQSYIMRHDLSIEEVIHVSVEMFGVRIDGYESKSKRIVQDVLSQENGSATKQRTARMEGGTIEEELQETPSRKNGQTERNTPRIEMDGNREVGREMRMLRGDDERISNDRPYQQRRRAAQENNNWKQQGELSTDLQGHQESGIPEEQVSNPVHELQLLSRVLGILSSHHFDENEIPDSVRFAFTKEIDFKPKDEVDIPGIVCEALRRDGWYRRATIIWHKPNPMPESVTDRPTKSHEYVFLLTKQARYYYDAEAIAEETTDEEYRTIGKVRPTQDNRPGFEIRGGLHNQNGGRSTRNRRSVWTIATSPYSGAHFATFPPALIEPMILAGTSARGECPQCGKAWVRVVDKKSIDELSVSNPKSRELTNNGMRQDGSSNTRINTKEYGHAFVSTKGDTIGWRPSCSCPPHEPIPQTVLDPFAGSGTTGQVAVKHGRRAVLLDLNTKYIDLQFERTNGVQVTMPL